MTNQSHDWLVILLLRDDPMPYPTFFNLQDDKRQKILDAAIEEFAENDYDSASISKIVERADISKGSMYQYFTDKHDLYLYLLELASNKKAEMMAAAKSKEPAANMFDYLRWLFRDMAAFESLYPRLAKIGNRAAYGKSPMPEEVVAQSKKATRTFFIELVEQGKKRGEIRSEIDASLAAFIFTSILADLGRYLLEDAGAVAEEIVESGRYPVGSPDTQEQFDQMIKLLQFGLSKEQPLPEKGKIR